jgi:hypothetical protein
MEREASEYTNAGKLTRMPRIKAGDDLAKRKLPSSPRATLFDSPILVGLEPLDQIVPPFSRSLATLLAQISTSPDIAKYLARSDDENREQKRKDLFETLKSSTGVYTLYSKVSKWFCGLTKAAHVLAGRIVLVYELS